MLADAPKLSFLSLTEAGVAQKDLTHVVITGVTPVHETCAFVVNAAIAQLTVSSSFFMIRLYLIYFFKETIIN